MIRISTKNKITVRYEQFKPSDQINFIIDRLTPKRHKPKFEIKMIDTMRLL